jgi:2,3,4,5-tetrahydropyridine-2-carboxylate N-succinyltransferase
MLQQQIEQLIEQIFDQPPAKYLPAHLALFQSFKDALNSGEVRAAEPDEQSSSGWRVNAWVKKGILLGFRIGAIRDMSIDSLRQPFFDKSTYPVKHITSASGVRIVPGGSSIRDGCFIGKGVTCMPPMFINVGAYVGDQTMIDSHALVGSCAQVGKGCHISAGAQIGGVLEPVGAMPVIIEDEVLVGGNCGIFEGTIVKRGAVLGTGVILNHSRKSGSSSRHASNHSRPRKRLGPLALRPRNRKISQCKNRSTHATRRLAPLAAKGALDP